MRLARHKIFNKHFKARILPKRNLAERFEKRLNLFLENPQNPLLKDHRLIGKMRDYRAFWVTGDVRVVYKIEAEEVELYDIGTHNQVY
ncbi:type II toxin-antitoxin system mRNA interferase toxin, RelE/StbE family [Candidatus Woesebacteria bacterium]|nr:type II toxin-antitoxin system mRNA interferase toxin, RelE/StbE family [Candidatus Woesebacteria bacterium]